MAEKDVGTTYGKSVDDSQGQLSKKLELLYNRFEKSVKDGKI